MSRESLIYGLSKAMSTDDKDKAAAGKRYLDDTQTLMSAGKTKNGGTGKEKPGEVKFIVSTGLYQDMARGMCKYYITNRRNLEIGQDVIFDEMKDDGMTATGNYMVKRILSIKSYLDVEGLKDGYFVITW